MQKLPAKPSNEKKTVDSNVQENYNRAQRGGREEGVFTREGDKLPNKSSSSENQSTTTSSQINQTNNTTPINDNEVHEQPSDRTKLPPKSEPKFQTIHNLEQPDEKSQATKKAERQEIAETVFIDKNDPVSVTEATAIIKASTIVQLRFLVSSMLFPDETPTTKGLIAGYAPTTAYQRSNELSGMTHIARLLSEFNQRRSDDIGRVQVPSGDMAIEEVIKMLVERIRTTKDDRTFIQSVDKLGEYRRWIKAGSNTNAATDEFAQLLQDYENKA